MTTVPTARRRRGPLLPTLVIAIALLLAFLGFTSVWTDKLWFDSLGYAQVFSTRLWTTVALFAGFGLATALIVAGSAWLAYWRRPAYRSTPLSSAVLERYRALSETRLGVVLFALAAVSVLFGGMFGVTHWDTFLAWWHAVDFGQRDPQFGLDLSFFLFDYPWYTALAGVATMTMVFATGITALIHYVCGGITTGQQVRLTTFAQRQLSIMMALIMLLIGVQLWLGRYGMALESKDLLTGITYVDDHVRLSAQTIAAVVAGIVALLFLSVMIFRRWVVPFVGIGLLLLTVVLTGWAYPAVIQNFSVNPDEPDKERPYIERNIAATRDAYGIDDIRVENYSAVTQATAGQLRADAEALPGIRLIDPAIIGPAFEQLQQVKGYYSFPDLLDVDRYTIEGDRTDAVVAARELNLDGLESQSWNNLRTVYTHGYGLVAAYGNQRQPGGEPSWIVRDIPPTGKLAEHEPRIYFGELHTEYSIVGAPADAPPIELDTPGGGENGGPKLYTYTGKGGVPIGSVFRKLLYATKFGDVNIMLSERVNEESRIIYNRTPRERVEGAAPWLTVDTNAFPAIVDGRLVWILDGYTTSNSYPNSHRLSLEGATSDSETSQQVVGAQPDRRINYMRNSVKAVVGAYDGSVTLYAWDDEDPILKTWQKVYPGTVKDRSEISDDLMQHLRYPEDQFKVQREVLGRYHVTDPHVWYQQTDRWTVPDDPVAGKGVKESPFYLSVKLPGDEEPVFSQTTVFVPLGRSNLASYMAVNADASSEDYGKITILRMSDTHQIDGPGQTFNAMTTDDAVAEKLRRFLNQGAANAKYGNLLTLPVGGGLLYVQPVYAERQGGTAAYPTLQFVIVRFGEHIGIGDTLQEALDQVFGGDAGADTGENVDDRTGSDTATPPAGSEDPPSGDQPGGGSTDTATAAKELTDAQAKFAEADEALKTGDLATYQQKITEGRAAVSRAEKALGG